MGIHYYKENVQISHSLSKKEILEINRHFLENPEKICRLYWFDVDNDFSFLKEIKNVKKLEINYSKIEDFKFLDYINDIEYLDISEIDGNPDITPIGQLSALKTLNINLRKSTKQNNLSCLNNLNNLEELHLFGKFKKKSLKLNFNGLKTFSPQLNCIDINELPQLKSLRRLDIINQKLETLSGLENCIRLNTILLNNVKIENQNILSPIFKLKELETISLSYIKTITDFTFIKDKSPIKNIYLWSLNGLESIKGIEKLYLLEKYSQRGEHENKNAIDFSELLKLKKLKEVEIKIGKTNKDAESKLNIIIKQIINKRSSSA